MRLKEQAKKPANNGATISEVAKMASASIATVSRVFNGHPYVSKSTAERVMEAVSKLGYSPNVYSRTLRSGKTNTIGLLRSATSISDDLYGETIANNLVRFISAEGYGVSMEFLTQSGESRLQVPSIVVSKRVDGLIIIGHLSTDELEQIAKWDLPVCLINNQYDHPNFYSSSLNDYSGSREVVQYLAALGRRRIGYVYGNIEWPSTNGRYRGYIDGMREIGLEPSKNHVVQVADDQQNYAGGYLATLEMLKDKNNHPDAIFYVNDWYAVGGVAAIQTCGLRVGEDVSVVGYDDGWMARTVIPALTTVSLQPEEICHSAAAILVRAIEGRPVVVKDATIRPKMVVRDSCTVLMR